MCRVGLIDRHGRGLVDDKYMVGQVRIVCGLSSGRSVYQLRLDSRKKQKQNGQLFDYFSVPFVFSIDLQERHRQIPDVGRGEQIVCDKQIVGADELFAKRGLRDMFPHTALIYSRVDRAVWEDGSTEFWTSDRYSCCKPGL